MPTLRELLSVIAADQDIVELECRVRERWPGQRVYVPPKESRKNLALHSAILRASRDLPLDAVAERYRVPRWRVARIVRRGK